MATRILKRYFLTIIVLSEIQQKTEAEEPCETTKIIDDWHRSTAYITNGTALCDSTIQEGWYRVTSGAGQLMPTQCVDINHCGTTFPIYVSNDGVPIGENIYPPPGVEVSRVAYAAILQTCRYGGYNIRIKNCDLYYVYYLVRPSGCNLAYCFGSELPCPVGESSPTGFSPGCDIRKPNITMTPVISVDEYTERKATGHTEVTPMFSCNAVEATVLYNYDIKYYINDVLILDAVYINVPYNDIKTAILRQKHWDHTFKPNMLVTCSMQARYKTGGSPSEKHVSGVYFAGIKTIDTENGVFVEEDKQIKIGVQVTIPIGCTNITGVPLPCEIYIQNGLPNYQEKEKCTNINFAGNDLEFVEKGCRLTIPYNKWKETHYITVNGKSNDVVDKADRIVFLRLYTPPTSANILLEIWNKIILPDVKVYIKDADFDRIERLCYSHNDPHMRIFDGKRWELQRSVNQGEYIMYKHERLPQQVNAYFRPCLKWDALCNCGVAVRSANSIFIANYCPGGHSNNIQTNSYMITRMCDDQNLVVENKGSDTIKITLPSGTTVTFRHGLMWNHYYGYIHVIHSIDILPSFLDYELTSGLCGNYSSLNGEDDFVGPNGAFYGLDQFNHGVDFGQSWKVPLAESFFNANSLPQLTYKVQEYCTCIETANKTQGTFDPPYFFCELSDTIRTCRLKDIPQSVVHAKCITTTFGRKRRSVNEYEDVPDMFPILIDNTDVNPESMEWRNNLTEEIARQKCEDAFEKRSAYSVCKEYVSSVKAQDYFEECVKDMKITGSDVFLATTIETFESNCVHNAAKMEVLKDLTGTDEFGNIKSIFDLIAESVCPNNCSARGVCNAGVCECQNGYYGSDCSLDETTPPKILRHSLNGKCDSSSKPCLAVYIPGMDFISSNPTCKYRGIKLFKDGTAISDQWSTTKPGEYINSFQMKCFLPKERNKRSAQSDEVATGFHISVSNDGTTFSEEATVLIYDATCFECNPSALTCRELDTCESGDLGNDTNNDTGNNKRKDERSNYMIIGLAVGVSFIVLVIGILSVMIIKNRCFKRSPYITDSFFSLPDLNRPMTAKSVMKESDIFVRIKTSESFNKDI